jgi:hypothetical protein
LGSLVGLSLGTLQWFVLKQRVRQAGWWIFASIISVTAGFLIKYDCNCTVDSEAGVFSELGTYAFIYIGAYAVISGIFLTAMTAPFNLYRTEKISSEVSDADSSTR